MLKVILIQAEPKLHPSLARNTERPSPVEVTETHDAETAVRMLEPDPARVAAIVIGPAADDPLHLTQRLHAIDPDLSIVLLTDAGREPALRRRLRDMPELGEDVTTLSASHPELVAESVIEAAERRQRRQAYAHTATMMNRRPDQALPPPPVANPFERLLDHAPIGIVTIDESGAVRGWNRQARTILDRRQRDVLGEPLALLFPMPDREQVHDRLMRIIQGERLSPATFERSRTDGGAQYIELSGVGVEVDDHRPGAVVLLQDVTASEQARRQRERVERDLRQQRRWFQATILSIGDALIATDERGRVTLMNGVAEQLTGWSLHEAAGEPSDRVFHIVDERTGERVHDPIDRVLREGQPASLANHTLLIARDGREVPIDDSGAPIRDDEGNLIGSVLVFRDIRERRRTEQALRESEQRFRTIFEQAATGIALVSPARRLTQVNQRFCQILGYTRDELLAMEEPIPQLTHPDDLALDTVHTDALLAGEATRTQIEKRYIHKDGHTVWVDLGVSVLKDEQGRIQQLIGIAEDITERKRAEAALQASEERLRLILDSLADYAIFSIDREGHIISWNDGARRLVGYEASEILGQPSEILFSEADRRADRPAQELREALAHGQAMDERWYVRKDGSSFWASELVTVLGQGTDEPEGFVKVLRDQTEAKRSREQLQERACQQAAVALFGQRALEAPDLASLLDEAVTLVARTLRVPLVAALRLVPEAERFELEAQLGWRLDPARPAHVDTGLHSQAGYTVLKGQPVVTPDFDQESRFTPSPLLLEQGERSAASVIIDAPSDAPWGVLSVHDQTPRAFTDDDVNFLQAMANTLATAIQRSRTEQELRELNQTLEQRVAERAAVAEQRADQLRALTTELTQTEQRERRRLAQVLHDHLQQMLVAGKLQLGLARKAVHDEKATEALQRIDELLTRSIQESRSLTVELSPPVLYDAGLVAGLDWLGRWMKEQHGLDVEVQAEDDADPLGNDLRVLMFQTARELLFNIVKHAEVDVAEIALHRDAAHRIVMQVRDRGRGFDPRRVERSEEDRGGFGLFSIRERLVWLGGDFQITSEPGEGTCATVIVPESSAAAGASQPAEEPAPAASAEPAVAEAVELMEPPFERVRVLLADDHEIIREGLVGILNAQPDIEVVGEAENGHVALELARELHPDVAVLDVTMPRMNGIEAARLITSECPDIRVIGLSVHESADMAEAMRAAGAATYLNKAGPSERLINAVRAVRAQRA